MVTVACNCGTVYELEDRFGGRRGRCRRCGSSIQIPQGRDSTPPHTNAAASSWSEAVLPVATFCGELIRQQWRQYPHRLVLAGILAILFVGSSLYHSHARKTQADEVFRAINGDDQASAINLIQRNPQLLTSRDAEGWTMLHAAVYWGQVDVVRALVELGADVNATVGWSGVRPLDAMLSPDPANLEGADLWAFEQKLRQSDYATIVRYLKAHGAKGKLFERTVAALQDSRNTPEYRNMTDLMNGIM